MGLSQVTGFMERTPRFNKRAYCGEPVIVRVFLRLNRGGSIVSYVSLTASVPVVASGSGTIIAERNSDDIHVHVAKIAHNTVKGSDTLAGVEAKFNRQHDKLMDKLSNALSEVSKTVDGNKVVEFVELNGSAAPIIDGTGSLEQGAPKANLKRFKVKPAIEAAFVQDEKLVKPSAQQQQSTSFTAPTSTPVTPTALLEVESEGENEIQAEVVATVDVDGESEAESETDADTETEADSDSEVESSVDNEMEAETNVDAEMMVEEVLAELTSSIVPIIDDTGSLGQGGPKANLTRFKVKPVVDVNFVPDVLPTPSTTAFLESESTVTPIIDDTGSASYAPKANLKRFKLKPTIDATLVQDVKSSQFDKARPTALKSLIELRRSSNCPDCKKVGMKRSYEVVLSPHANPNSLDAPLFEEQHNKINYLIKDKTLSIRQDNLDAAKTAVLEAADAHERFADFTEKHQNMPLLPQGN